MRFSMRTLLVQVAIQVAVVAVCAAVFLGLGVRQLGEEADSSALNIARTVAAAPEVRELVAAYSAGSTPDAPALQDGALQQYATEVTTRTEGLFVVITDDHGIRLAHPNPDRLGEQVSTSFADALAGRETVTWETGTLGESVRAKVPVYPPDGGAPVGEVSVGFDRASVFDDLPPLVGGIGVAVAASVLIGVLAAYLSRRRLERVTLGVQPEELVALVQTQTAVLDDAGAGVVAIDPAGVVRVCTGAAERMLGITEAEGENLEALALPEAVARALREGAPEGLLFGERIVYIDVRPVTRGARDLGTAALLRDRTDLVALTERLDSVRAMSDALRVQRHEYANRLHAVAGLIDAGRVAEAREFVGELAERGAVDYGAPGLKLVTDPFLQSFLGAKAVAAGERGVTLFVGEDTLLAGTVREVEDAVAVLGNLIDNAVAAAAAAPAPRGVEVTLLTDADALVVTVADSGPGVADPESLFRPRTAGEAPVGAVHGLGIGLPLSRELARRRGGEVWLIDAGGADSGAVFGARIPGIVTSASEPEEET